MRDCELLEKIRKLPSIEFDGQIVSACHNSYVSIKLALSQYKYCLEHNIIGDNVDSLRKYLIFILSEDIICQMEGEVA